MTNQPTEEQQWGKVPYAHLLKAEVPEALIDRIIADHNARLADQRSSGEQWHLPNTSGAWDSPATACGLEGNGGISVHNPGPIGDTKGLCSACINTIITNRTDLGTDWRGIVNALLPYVRHREGCRSPYGCSCGMQAARDALAEYEENTR